PERRDHRLDLVAPQHLVEAGLLDVQNLALDRKNGLEPPVTSLLGRTAGRFAFDDVDFTQRRIAFLAVRQFAGQRAVVEGALAPDQITSLPRGLARTRGVNRLGDNPLRDRRVLLEVRPQLVVQDGFDDALDFSVAKLRFRLPFELGSRNLDADDGNQTFADVVAADARIFEILREVVLARVEVHRARQRRAETGQVCAALVRVDVVGKRIDRLGVAVVPLQSDLDVDAVLFAVHVDWLVVDRRLVLVQILDE